MTNEFSIVIDNVSKMFQTRHLLKRDEDTGKRFLFRRKSVQAVKGVSFSIRPGEIFGLLGPNGAGKTTTVKMLSGLIRPTSGRIYVDGLYVESKRLQVLTKIGVVLEGTRTCVWPLTPLENLSYFGNLKNVRGPILRKRSLELLEFMGLKDKMNVEVRRLSRGQKQKLAICIALIADPPVILLDEPTTGLDVQSGRAIKDKIREMALVQKKTVLVTTHDMFTAQELCTRIGIINNGGLVACKPTDELLDVFSDQAYEIRLDAAPNESALRTVPGVTFVDISEEPEGVLCVVRVEWSPDVRSSALYGVVEHLRDSGLQLRSISQRQPSLESVFLTLTTSSMLHPVLT